MELAFKIAYDGTRFKGSARQPDQRTVEGSMIKALQDMGAVKKGSEGGLRSSSRTDKGVSSLGNIVTVNSAIEGEKVVRAMNGSFSQEGLWFLGWAEPPEDFRPRHAKQRWYRYAYPVGPELDIDRMKEVSILFEGEHDFKAFSKVDKSDPDKTTVRSIDSIIVTPLKISIGSHIAGTYGEVMAGMIGGKETPLEPPLDMEVVLVDIYGQSFLWQMVRRIVSAMVGVAKGDHELEVLETALSKGVMKGGKGTGVLPAENLVLMDVAHSLKFVKVEGIEALTGSIRQKVLWPVVNQALFHDQLLKRLL